MTKRRRRRRIFFPWWTEGHGRSTWWAEIFGPGRIFGRRRVTRYKGRVYAVAPREAYRKRRS